MKYAQIILAGALLLCLAPMPYGYYNLIRLASTIIFGIMAYIAFVDHKIPFGILYVGIALLFQPFIKIALGRILWNIIDVICAILLVVQTIRQTKQKQ